MAIKMCYVGMERKYQLPVEYAVIGNVTRDVIVTETEDIERIGGSTYFVSKTLLDLGNNVRIHTNADEIPQILLGKGVDRTGLNSTTVTVTINEVRNKAQVNYPGEKIIFSQLPPEVFTVDCTVLAPTFGEISGDDVKRIREAQDQTVVADIQGFMRVFDPKTHGASKKPTDIEIFRGFDILKMNQGEVDLQFPGASFDQAADELQRLGIGVSVFTLGRDGVIVYADQKYEIATVPVTSRHTVGAGDTFFASFLNTYVKNKDVLSAGKNATDYTVRYLREECS